MPLALTTEIGGGQEDAVGRDGDAVRPLANDPTCTCA
jgi:hypothetical protein